MLELPGPDDAQGAGRPRRHLAVLTCMDCRIDVLTALGLEVGEAHVLRNGGARVTPDMLRSLAVSVSRFGTTTIVVMPHTRCGMVGVTDEELQAETGADLDFFTIGDAAATLQSDITALTTTPFLTSVDTFIGAVFDVDTGEIHETVRHQRIHPR